MEFLASLLCCPAVAYYLSVLCCKKSLFPWPLEHLGSEKPRNPLAAPALQALVIYAAASGIAADFSVLVNICQVYGKRKSLRLSFAARKWPPVIWVEILIRRATKPTPLESSRDLFPDPLTLTPLLADVAPMSLLLSSIPPVLVAPFPDPAAAPDPARGSWYYSCSMSLAMVVAMSTANYRAETETVASETDFLFLAKIEL